MTDKTNSEDGRLYLYDTMTRQSRGVSPMDGKVFRFYCCGPTVYGPAHIGNFRTFLLQDVLRRVLELSGMRTRHVRNITDVDDKTIRDSQKSGQSLQEFTSYWYNRLKVDAAKLNCLEPHVEPGAVAHIPEQIALIEELIRKGHAYPTEDGSVYYDVSSWQEYGKLSRLKDRQITTDQTTHSSRSDSDEYEARESLADFALWKGRKPEDGNNFWPSPWGEGRPGWHTECSAMSAKYLGKSFDLHSGGVDLIFPHHENEIAQSEACHCSEFAAHWFHIEHLMVDGGKMSKSLGNLYTVDDIEKLGHSANELRFVLVSGHYRQPLNFTLDNLKAARQALARLARFGQVLQAVGNVAISNQFSSATKKPIEPGQWLYFGAAWNALLDDLNTPKALGHVFTAVKKMDRLFAEQKMDPTELRQVGRELGQILLALGVSLPDPEPVNAPDHIQKIADMRWSARLSKDFHQSDQLRDQLKSLGWHVMDGRDSFQLVPLPGTSHESGD